MATVLEEIVAAKRVEVSLQKAHIPQSELEQRLAGAPAPLNLSGALWGDQARLIAEVKKASPSRGLLRADFDPATIARIYAENGAAAVSVLTDTHFQGALEHLGAVKQALSLLGVPVLRKDFIIDPYQLYESRIHGADAILLIVGVLEPQELRDLLVQAGNLWLQCLVEIHTAEELETALAVGAEIIGINNRDLHTFKTDLGVSTSLAPQVPQGKIIVSESGISSRGDLVWLHRHGVHGVLVGEALMTAPDIGARVRELLGQMPALEKEALP